MGHYNKEKHLHQGPQTGNGTTQRWSVSVLSSSPADSSRLIWSRVELLRFQIRPNKEATGFECAVVER